MVGMIDIGSFLISLLPAVITSVVVFYLQRSQKKRDSREEERAATRRAETKLVLDLQMASAMLSYATAMALKRGTANGEVEDGIKQYEKALEEFREFEREQLSKL